MHASPRNYGALISKLYSKVESDPRDLMEDTVLKIDLARGQLQWMIKMGDLILSSEPLEICIHFDRNLTEAGSKRGSVSIFSYDHEDIPPASYSRHMNGTFNHFGDPSSMPTFSSEPGLRQIHTLDYDLSTIPLQHHKHSDIDLRIHIASLVLKLRIATGGCVCNSP